MLSMFFGFLLPFVLMSNALAVCPDQFEGDGKSKANEAQQLYEFWKSEEKANGT